MFARKQEKKQLRQIIKAGEERKMNSTQFAAGKIICAI